MKKKINLILFGLTLSLGFIISLSSFRNSNQKVTLSTEALFEEEHPRTIQCESVHWTKTTYISKTGTVVGQTFIKGGTVEIDYTGVFETTTFEEGDIPGRQATMTDCYGWGWGCHKITAADACQ